MTDKRILKKRLRKLKFLINMISRKKHPTNNELHKMFHFIDEFDYYSYHLERSGEQIDL